MSSFAQWMARRPIIPLAANVLMTLVLGWFALQIRVESSLASVLPEGDPSIAYYAKVRETFGSDDVAVVGVRADDIFADSTLAKIERVTETLGKLKGVQSVASITNAPDPAADVVNPPRLLPNIPPSTAELAALKQKLKTIPLYGKNLVSDDFKGARHQRLLQEPDATPSTTTSTSTARFARSSTRETGPETFYFTGAAHLKQAAARADAPRSSDLHADRAGAGADRVLAVVPDRARRGPAGDLGADGDLLDARRDGARRQVDHARHVRPAAAAAGRRQLLRHPRDGALLRAGRSRHALASW